MLVNAKKGLVHHPGPGLRRRRQVQWGTDTPRVRATDGQSEIERERERSNNLAAHQQAQEGRRNSCSVIEQSPEDLELVLQNSNHHFSALYTHARANSQLCTQLIGSEGLDLEPSEAGRF